MFNKKGSSLVLAIVVIALISILSTLVLSLALNAYRTSVQSKWADEDFYYCEDCLEEVRQTMVKYVNDKIIDNYKIVYKEWKFKFSLYFSDLIKSKNVSNKEKLKLFIIKYVPSFFAFVEVLWNF